ncbi:MAG: multisubunit Na+/H+ antiporter MnhB subunit [Ilumatobacter sp.]|jgi:multisubunit Na+/H+ antiporter MnhB subunit
MIDSSSSPSPIVKLSIRAATPLALVIAVFVFFAGHNRPGGGFAAGLLIGAVLVLRSVAGLPLPFRAIPLLATGTIVAAAVAVAPMLWGDVFLDQIVVEQKLPLLGKVKSGSALIFDIGVTLIVSGLIVAVLDGFRADHLATPPPDVSNDKMNTKSST